MLRRVEAYGLCRSPSGVLTVPSPAGPVLPGGPLAHGEHPADAVVRLFGEATGAGVSVGAPLEVVAALGTDREHDVEWHADRLVFEVTVDPARVRPPAAWSPSPVGPPPVDLPWPLPPAPGDRGQRFAAYGLATDPADRVLLTLIAPGFPGAGRWHLPGGGTDFGEQPRAGLLRELFEETGQTGAVTGLITVGHRHNPAALGPEGRPMDWHAVRAVFRVSVPAPTVATVTEAAGGSTERARWFDRAELADLPLTDVVAVALDGRS